MVYVALSGSGDRFLFSTPTAVNFPYPRPGKDTYFQPVLASAEEFLDASETDLFFSFVREDSPPSARNPVDNWYFYHGVVIEDVIVDLRLRLVECASLGAGGAQVAFPSVNVGAAFWPTPPPLFGRVEVQWGQFFQADYSRVWGYYARRSLSLSLRTLTLCSGPSSWPRDIWARQLIHQSVGRRL